MGLQEKLREHADKLARKFPKEIAPVIEREELEKLKRLRRLAEAANKYLESIDVRQNSDKRSPMQRADSKFTFNPAGPDRNGWTPETGVALNHLFATTAREIAERNRRAQERAKVRADAFAQGGEEAAKKALKERLQKYLTLSFDEEVIDRG